MARLSEDARDPKTELKIAIVGPLMSFALAGIFWLIRNGLSGGQPSIFVEIFRYLSWINVALGVFNLLPGFPLVGGLWLMFIDSASAFHGGENLSGANPQEFDVNGKVLGSTHARSLFSYTRAFSRVLTRCGACNLFTRAKISTLMRLQQSRRSLVDLLSSVNWLLRFRPLRLFLQAHPDADPNDNHGKGDRKKRVNMDDWIGQKLDARRIGDGFLALGFEILLFE